MLRSWLGNSQGNNRDEAWLRDHLNALLTEKQQTYRGGDFDLSHILRDHFDSALAAQLSDEAIAATIERYSHQKQSAYRNARAILIAERTRREGRTSSVALRIAKWALVVALIGIAIDLAPFVIKALQAR